MAKKKRNIIKEGVEGKSSIKHPKGVARLGSTNSRNFKGEGVSGKSSVSHPHAKSAGKTAKVQRAAKSNLRSLKHSSPIGAAGHVAGAKSVAEKTGVNFRKFGKLGKPNVSNYNANGPMQGKQPKGKKNKRKPLPGI